LPPLFRRRRGLRARRLRGWPAALRRRNFRGDFVNGDSHGSRPFEAEFAAKPAAPADIGAQTGRTVERRFAADPEARVAIGRHVLSLAVEAPALAVTRSPANAPSVAERRAMPETPALAPMEMPAPLAAPAPTPPPAPMPMLADAPRPRPPPTPMPAPMPMPPPMPMPSPPAAKAAGGFNVIEALTVSGEPLPKRRFSWPLA
jgi:hypothetical protein